MAGVKCIYICYIGAYTSVMSVMYPGMKLDEINNSWSPYLCLAARISLYQNITIKNKNKKVNGQRGNNKDTTKFPILSKRFIICVGSRTQGVV